MDTHTSQPTPAPDHGPDDSALVRVLRLLAVPLRARPIGTLRRDHIAAASAAARGGVPARPTRAHRRWAPALRPVLAGGLTLSLVAGLAAVVVGVPDGLLTRGTTDDVEIAMEFGFTPSPVPFERTEDHVILTVGADRAELVTQELARLLDADPTVLSVRSDRTAFTVPASVAALLEVADVEVVADTPVRSTSRASTQSPVPSWGLDRIDAEDDPLDGSYGYVSTGSGVTVYVIDTGVRSDHADLGGRVSAGWSAIDDGRGTEDCNGHGTHVAGTVAGSSFGVAKGAGIVAVRVLDCAGGGFASSVVSGISWVIANHPGGPGVINLSLGGPANSALDRAVADATARGLVVVAAAGNAGGDACAVSPARSSAAVTIGATTASDSRASYSNFGPCVDLFAPGSGITSAWHTGAGASATLSGTSMAAPHVAGIAARLLQANPGAGPARITSLLTGSAQSGVVSGADGSANLLVNLVDTDDEASECELLYEEGLEEGERIPDECLDEICELIEEDGAALPEECLEREDDEDGDEREGRDGEGRPDGVPGLGGLLPPGFGGTVPGLERAPGLAGRTPPGLVDGVPPGLVRDAPRVNGLSVERDGSTVTASWRVSADADAFVLECSAARPGPSWSTDLTLRLAADVVTRSGDRVAVALGSALDGLSRCRVAAESAGVLGVRSNAAPIPSAPDEDEDGDAGESRETEAGRPAVPGAPGNSGEAGRPAVPGAPGAPVTPGTPPDPGSSSRPEPPANPGRPDVAPNPPSRPEAPSTSNRPELNPGGRRN
jgi:subtilisin family serine protease